MLKKAIRKGLIFLLLLGVILTVLGPLFVYKIDHRGKLRQGLYSADDSYDVVLMGSSHMNGGLDPNVLWNRYGITSFNYATGGQPIDVTYYLLKEVLKKHKNPVVVMDVFYLGLENPYGESGFTSNVLDNMRFSKNKVDAVLGCTAPEEWVSFFFPFLKYHFRWSDLSQKDLTYDGSEIAYEKGFKAGTTRYGKENQGLSQTSARAEIPAKTLGYLNKIIELSKQENFQLVFVNFPCDYTEPNKEDGWVNDCAALFNTVADIAEENSIPFVDCNGKTEEIGLDFAQDMNNSGHLNIWGAVKVSGYIGGYLKQNFDLEDHRTDSAYAQWDSDYKLSQAASLEQ